MEPVFVNSLISAQRMAPQCAQLMEKATRLTVIKRVLNVFIQRPSFYMGENVQVKVGKA
jgi:hypothetical protein